MIDGWPKGAMDVPGNDDQHNFTDPNKGGSPLGGQDKKRIPTAQRGGFGHNGRDRVAVRASMPSGRSGTGNPAQRGGAVGSFPSQSRIPGHGGSPQTGKTGQRANFDGGFGAKPHGQSGVPSYPHAAPTPKAGNLGGLAAKRVVGRFKRAAMGARPTDSESGKWGSPPVTSNT